MSTSTVVNKVPDPWEPGEDFSFISEVTDVFSASANNLRDIRIQVNLVATSGKFGVLFASDQNLIKAYQTSSVIDNKDPKPFKTFQGRGRITHLETSCDSQTLLVVSLINETPFGIFYNVPSLMSLNSPPAPFYLAPLSTHLKTLVSSIAWNPCDATSVAIALSNGDLSVIKINDSSVEFNSQKNIQASAVTWSAKGKQLAVGKMDGTIALYKPDLTPVRTIDRPPQQPAVGTVVNLTWFTNTEFFVGYLCDNNGSPALYYLNAPKGKPAIFYTFEDVCYSGENRNKSISYFTHFFSEWNVLVVLSSHGVEMGVVGKNVPNPTGECQWCQWFPEDDARASMNFINVVDETFPLGMALDFTATRTMINKDEIVRGPFPVIYSLSTGGELNSFFVENKLKGVPKLTVAKEPVPTSGFRTPQQYGQQALPPPETVVSDPQPVINLERSASSAFSSVGVKPFAFSTPVKPTGEQQSAKLPSFSSPFGNQPVSLSSEVGASRNIALHVPSPKKTLNPTPLGTSQLSIPGAFQQNQHPSNPTLQPSTTTATVHPTTPTGALPPYFSNAPRYSQQPAGAVSNTPCVPAMKAGSPQIQFPKPFEIKTPARSAESTITVGPTLPKSLLVEHLPKQPPKVSKDQLLRIIRDEAVQFEEELKMIRNASASTKYQIGSKEDESREANSLAEIKNWMNEMKITTAEQSDEVSQLHEKTFGALASYEDTISHTKNKTRNQMYMQLRPLDPYSQRRLEEIRTKHQYLLSQLGDVNTKLDLQWENYSSNKKSSRKGQATTKNLYRSVLSLHTCRVNLEKNLDSICQKMKCISFDSLITTDSPSSKNSSDFNKRLNESHISPKKNSTLLQVLNQRSITPIRKQVDPGTGGKKRPTVADNLCESFISSSENVRKPLYEDISPPDSPLKSASKPANPLGALSSLIGKVSDTNKLGGSFSNKKDTPSAEIRIMSPSAKNSLFGSSSKNMPNISSSFFSNKSSITNADKRDHSGASLADTFKPKGASSVTPFSLNVDSKSLFGDVAALNSSTSAKPQGELAALLAKSNAQANSNLDSANLSELNLTSILRQSKDNLVKPLFVPQSTTASIPVVNSGLGSSNTTMFNQGSPASKNVILPNFATLLGTTSSALPTVLGATEEKTVPATNKTGADNSFVTPTNLGIKMAGNSPSSNSHIPAKINLSLESTSSSTSSFNNPMSSSKSLFQSTASSSSPSTTPSLLGQLISAPNSQSSSSFGLSTASILSLPVVTQNSSLLTALTAPALNSQTQSSGSLFGIQTTTNSSPLIIPQSQSSSLFSQTSSLFNQPAVTSQEGNASTGQTTPSTKIGSLLGQVTVNTTPASQGTSLFAQSTIVSQSSSLFGQSPTVTQSGSLLGQTPVASQSASLFGQIAPTTQSSSSIFGQPNASQSGSIFGGSGITSTSNNSLFGQPTSAQSSSVSAFSQPTTTSTSSIFGQPASTSAASVYSQPPSTSSPSIFGQPATTSAASVFGQPSLTSTPSVFGQPATTSAASMFGQPSSTSTPSVFGQPATTSATSIFGQPSLTSTPSVFGQPATTSVASVFGQPSSTSTPSIFGQPATTSTASVFGQPSSTSTPSVFGQHATTSAASVFGQPSSTSTPSIFGQPATTSAASVFGQPSSTSTPSIFGQPATTSAASVFGQPAPTPTASVFGQPAPTPTASVFGQPSGGLGTSSSLFGNNPSEATNFSGSAFGANSSFGQAAKADSSSSVFGGTSAFGNKSTSSASVFGSPQSPSSIFGGGNVATTATVTSNQQSVFSSGFGTQQTPNSSSSLFSGSSMFSGLGKPPNQENASKNVFGSTSGASGGATQTNIFGGGGTSGGSLFGGASANNSASALAAKPGGAFSPVKSAFGASASFGGAPTFGGTAAFGSPPVGSTFGGGGATFGSAFGGGGNSTFGSGTSVFGGSSGGTFGSAANSSGGFNSFGGSAAGGGTGGASFGDSANQTGRQNESSLPTFGGNSFSSWR